MRSLHIPHRSIVISAPDTRPRAATQGMSVFWKIVSSVLAAAVVTVLSGAADGRDISLIGNIGSMPVWVLGGVLFAVAFYWLIGLGDRGESQV